MPKGGQETRGGTEGTYQIDGHAEAPLRLVLADLLPARAGIPHVEAPVVGRARQELAILGERYGPDFARLVAVCSPSSAPQGLEMMVRKGGGWLTEDRALLLPPLVPQRPDLGLPIEASAGELLAVGTGNEVVAAERMNLFKRLF